MMKKNKKQNVNRVTRENFFIRMFLDKNDINEKSIVGFGSFIMMVICLIIDIITGLYGVVLPINEFIFQGFLWITLGSFGIASVDKFINQKNGVSSEDEYEEEQYEEDDNTKSDNGGLML
jgi:hypothetical protein